MKALLYYGCTYCIPGIGSCCCMKPGTYMIRWIGKIIRFSLRLGRFQKFLVNLRGVSRAPQFCVMCRFDSVVELNGASAANSSMGTSNPPLSFPWIILV